MLRPKSATVTDRRYSRTGLGIDEHAPRIGIADESSRRNAANIHQSAAPIRTVNEAVSPTPARHRIAATRSALLVVTALVLLNGGADQSARGRADRSTSRGPF